MTAPDNPMNVVSLKDHFDTRFYEHEKMHHQLAENVRTSLASNDVRLAGMNEFRQTIEDVVAKTLTRDEYDRRHDELIRTMAAESKDKQRQIDDMKRRFAILTGVALVLVPLSGLIGAAITKAFHL